MPIRIPVVKQTHYIGAGTKFSVYSENVLGMINYAAKDKTSTAQLINDIHVIRKHQSGKEGTVDRFLSIVYDEKSKKLFPMLGNSTEGRITFGLPIKKSIEETALVIINKLAQVDKKGRHGIDKLLKKCLPGQNIEHVQNPPYQKGRYTVTSPKSAIIDAMVH